MTADVNQCLEAICGHVGLSVVESGAKSLMDQHLEAIAGES